MRKVECTKFNQKTPVAGVFLCWGVESEEIEQGVLQYTVAVVELEDGRVDTFMPSRVKFLPESTLWKSHLHREDVVKFDTTLRAPPGKMVCGA